tara:strand:- start:3526 stop:4383 length:858 start_codon:yes stop_codon:yes gene_type:complete
MRGHSGPGDVRASPDISVIGPLARSADDLYSAIKIMAGPDEIMSRGYQLKLPELGDRPLSDLKIGVWKNDAAAPVANEVEARVDLVVAALRDAGAHIAENAKPEFSAEHSNEVYQRLLHATMASRMPLDSYESLKTYVANELDPEDHSTTAQTLRAQVASFKEWGQADELRHQLRWRWHEYFKQYDLLITPIMATAAFKHDQRPFAERTLQVDNQERPYFEQVFWAGLTGVAYLPSTVIPTGLNDIGLPIGVQIIGPQYGDLITIGVAQKLEQMGFVFEAPAAYR